MATNSQIAFNQQGETVVVAASAVAPAGVQVPVYERFKQQETGQIRIVNASANVVHLGYGQIGRASCRERVSSPV